LLSRPALHQGFERAGRGNTGIHEFVHLLDMADGETNGIPHYFLENSYLIPWVEMMRSAMAAIERDESDIDDYALTNQAEFFSVAAEYFFNRPHAFAEHHPKLFGLMERIFAQDLDRDGAIG
ncbi:MAG: zinc-dependent peptidase, partial [Bacteroidota bacterium]